MGHGEKYLRSRGGFDGCAPVVSSIGTRGRARGSANVSIFAVAERSPSDQRGKTVRGPGPTRPNAVWSRLARFRSSRFSSSGEFVSSLKWGFSGGPADVSSAFQDFLEKILATLTRSNGWSLCAIAGMSRSQSPSVNTRVSGGSATSDSRWGGLSGPMHSSRYI